MDGGAGYLVAPKFVAARSTKQRPRTQLTEKRACGKGVFAAPKGSFAANH